MKNNKNKSISVHELQAKASQVVKDVSLGYTYHVMRYSKPTAVLISQEEYDCLTGKCRGCVKELVDDLKKSKAKK